MISESFEYHVPKTIEEALGMIGEFGDESKVLAGGHSLLPMMKLRLASPKHLIDIGRIGALRYIRESEGQLEFGALTTHFEIESSSLLKSKCPLLPETAREIGDVQVRNRGTLGGSLVHADPAADWPAAMLAVEAEMVARGPHGERKIRARDFFVDLMATSLHPDELLTAIRVSPLPARTGDAYLKLHHPASGFAVVGVAVRLTLAESGSIGEARVGVTGVGAKPYRAEETERLLAGKSPTAKRLEEAAAHAADGVDANSDLYASGDYRKHLAAVYARRAIQRAAERAAGR